MEMAHYRVNPAVTPAQQLSGCCCRRRLAQGHEILASQHFDRRGASVVGIVVLRRLARIDAAQDDVTEVPIQADDRAPSCRMMAASKFKSTKVHDRWQRRPAARQARDGHFAARAED